jgi:hypothetical protein
MKYVRHLVLAALVAGSILAVPASANGSALAANQYTASVHATTGIAFNLANVEGETPYTNCAAAPLDGGSLAKPGASPVLSPTGKGKCAGGLEVNMNGCTLTLRGSTADLGSAGCGPIIVPWGTCNTWVWPKNGLTATYFGKELTGVEGFRNAEEVEVTGYVPYTNCGPSGNAWLTARWALSATNEAKQPDLLIWSRDYTPAGLRLTEETHPKFQAQFYPAVVTGVRWTSEATISPLEKLSGVNLNTACKTPKLFNEALLAKETTATLSIAGTYKECTTSVGAVTVSMNSCRYKFPEFEKSGSLYNAKGGSINCTKEGDAISIKAGLGCEMKLPPQPLSATMEQSTEFNWASVIPLHITGSGLKWTATKACSLVGIKEAGEDGVMNQELVLRGEM